MSRWYDVTFSHRGERTDCGQEDITFRSSGNTRRTAEGTSRGKLRSAGHDPKEWVITSTVYAPDGRGDVEDE